MFSFILPIASIFITCLSACCYYTAILLIDLQEKGQGTYSEVADNIMGVGFSRFTVRPAQFLNFFPLTAIMILVGGQALATVDSLDGVQHINKRWWLVIVSFIYYYCCLFYCLLSLFESAEIGNRIEK